MRSETTNRPGLDSVDGQCAAVNAPACGCPQILVVITQMPYQIADLGVAERPVVRDAGDAAQCVVLVGVGGGVDLADDRVFGTGHGGQLGHRRSHTVAAVMAAHRFQRPRRVG
jgi:hypothetical protein